MKKLAVIFGLAALLIVGGCTEKEEGVSGTTGSITIPNADTKVVAVNLTSEQQNTIYSSFNNSDNYIDALIANEEIIAGNSESMGKVIKAVKLFQNVDTTLNKAGTPVLSLKDLKNVKGAVKRLSKNITRMEVREEGDMLAADYQATIKKDVMPKLDEAVKLLKEAVEANETVVLMSAEENGMNVKIEPAHILLVESLVKCTRGYLSYMLGYDFEMLDADTQEYNDGFLTVVDRDYINKSKDDLKEGIDEMISALNAMPESDIFVFSKDNYLITENKDFNITTAENILSIPKSLKTEAVTVLTQVRNSMEGTATITVNGYSIKLNLGAFFKESFELVDIMNAITEMVPAEEDTIESWNQEPLANYTFEGILPDGLKNVIDESGEGRWDEFVNGIFTEEDIQYYEDESYYSGIDTVLKTVKKSKK